jgi:hypothetical protein
MLAPVLHARFDNDLKTLGDVDSAVCTWRDAVRDVRVLARQRRADDLRRGILIAAVCPGLIDTGASRRWLDTTHAQTPAEAAEGLLDLALGPDPDPGFYGELVLFGKVVPWKL